MHLFQHADELQPPKICKLPPVHMNPPSAGDHENWTPRSSASHHHSLGINHLPLQPGQGSACHEKRRTPKNDNAEYSSKRFLLRMKKVQMEETNKNCQYHSQEVPSGWQSAAMRDLCTVSGRMGQCTVLLKGYLDRQTDCSAF